jgi:hypothetical protein
MTETGPASKILCMKTPQGNKEAMFIVNHHNQQHSTLSSYLYQDFTMMAFYACIPILCKTVLRRNASFTFKPYISACVSFDVLTVVTIKIDVFCNVKTRTYPIQQKCRNFVSSSYTLITETATSSEMSVHFTLYQTAWYSIIEDSYLLILVCDENALS